MRAFSLATGGVLFELARQRHVDQRWAIARHGLGDQVGRLMHGPGPLARNAERAREPDEVDRRVVQLHADVTVELRRIAALRENALLEDAVGGVVENHESDAELVARRGPQRL